MSNLTKKVFGSKNKPKVQKAQQAAPIQEFVKAPPIVAQSGMGTTILTSEGGLPNLGKTKRPTAGGY